MPNIKLRKYELLGIYLAKLKEKRITLSFIEIEKIINAPLPPSARDENSEYWWSNDYTSHSQSIDGWLSVNWIVVEKNIKQEEIMFQHVNSRF